MSRLVALAVSGMLVSVAPATAFDDTTGSQQYGTVAVRAPAPAPSSVILDTAREVVVAAPVAAPPAYAAVPFSSAGLGSSAIAFSVLGVAAIGGIAALAANSDSSNSTR